MKISYLWLKRYLSTELSPEKMAEVMTFLGLDVDSVEELCEDPLKKVVMARLKQVERLPDRDLFVCTVDAGSFGERTVVSGAPNCRCGAYSPLAVPGTLLPDGTRVGSEEFGDVVSEGMLCSAAELGLEAGPADRLIMVDSAETGAPAKQALGLDDWILQMDLTPNYAAHCQSHLGVARELAAAGKGRLRRPKVDDTGDEHVSIEDVVQISVEDADLCPRYSAGLVDEVDVGPSCWSVQRDLIACGVRPINNVVDATNWVMLEYGQPLHAFDLHQVQKNEVVVRRAREGERIVTLDGEEHQLRADDLVIADAYRAIGIAGVMGGLNSEVGPDTERVLLESAYFDPRSILRTSRRLQKRTDASLRFEKGRDPEETVAPLRRVMQLLSAEGAKAASNDIIDVYPEPVARRRLTLRPERVNALLGTELSCEQMISYLHRLGFEVGEADEDGELGVVVPSWRSDVQRDIGLTEEIARLHGYNEIPSAEPKTAVAGYTPSKDERVRRLVRSFLSGAGFFEMVTYSWLSPDMLDALGVPDNHPHRRLIRVQNPMRSEQQYLRTTLLGSALKMLRDNTGGEGPATARLFEWGPVYLPEGVPLQKQPQERDRLVMAGAGPQTRASWCQSDPQSMNFFYLKGVLVQLMRFLHIGTWRVDEADVYYLHPGRSAQLSIDGQFAGYFGELHPDIADHMDLGQRVCIGELETEVMISAARLSPRAKPVPSYPASVRDIAVVVDEEVSHRQLVSVMKGSVGDVLESVQLFDIYTGQQVPEGQKSAAYRLIYRAEDRTLTDEEVQRYQEDIIEALAEDLEATLRS